jgi:hypothetical protein
MGLIAEEERQKELQLMEDFHSTATNVVIETESVLANNLN